MPDQTIVARTRLMPRKLLLWVLLLSVCGCVSGPPGNSENICDVFREKRSWQRAAVAAEKKWGQPMHIPLAIMYQESAFRKRARPPRKRLLGVIPWSRPSSAYGYAQAVDGTWAQYVEARREPWRVRTDFADANDFIHWFIAESGRRNGIAAHDAHSLYLSYHEGWSGYAQGSWHHKNWLINAAQQVQLRSQRYRTQYAACEEEFRPGFWRRLWSS